ncbi:phylloplanin-like [Bidens hawaiensis]|uniref:phylloplanin-like n=1 Tax=Bidens hawaiensis TaxID=980011 RepID=UPI00404AFD8E
MSSKSIILITILVVVLAATQAEAQLPSSPIVVFNIIGIVLCLINGSVNGTTSAPPFPSKNTIPNLYSYSYVVVQLSCGGNTTASTVTNALGGFSIKVTPPQFTLSILLSSCKVVVATPLSSCNPTLPSTGTLQGPLQYTGTTTGGTVNTLLVGLSTLLQNIS